VKKDSKEKESIKQERCNMYIKGRDHLKENLSLLMRCACKPFEFTDMESFNAILQDFGSECKTTYKSVDDILKEVEKL
jgi:hypothetical protein